jgi:hypothetical protein
VRTSISTANKAFSAHVTAARDCMEKTLKDADISKWSGEGAPIRTFRLERGGEISFTPAQIMRLMMLNHREAARRFSVSLES